MIQQNIPKAIVLTLMMSIVATLVAALTKFLTEHQSLHVIISIQFGVGILISLPILLRKGKAGFATERIGLHLVRGISGVASFYAFYLAITHVTLVEAILLRNSAPLCVPLVVLTWMGIKIPRLRWLPLAVGFLGVLLVLRPSPGNLNPWHLIGFSAAIFLAISMVSTRLLVATETNTAVIFYYFTFALAVSLPLALLTWKPVPWYIWLTNIAVGIGLYGAMNLYTLSFRYAKPSVLSPISYFGVVFGGFWGWLFWGQLPQFWTYAGIALVVASALITLKLGEGGSSEDSPQRGHAGQAKSPAAGSQPGGGD